MRTTESGFCTIWISEANISRPIPNRNRCVCLSRNCRVASSTQNQAFNALLFLYRHILKKDFGEHKDIPRAKRSSFIPVVLSRQEIEAVLNHLEHPYNLVVKLLYGCGLRLFECVKVRAKDFNFDVGILTAHGKGGKDRTVERQ